MTMVNLPLIATFFVGALCLAYGLLAVVLEGVGLATGREHHHAAAVQLVGRGVVVFVATLGLYVVFVALPDANPLTVLLLLVTTYAPPLAVVFWPLHGLLAHYEAVWSDDAVG